MISSDAARAFTGFGVCERLYESPRTVVYRAHPGHAQAPVILKVLKDDYPDPSAVAAYKHEYEITRRLRGAHVSHALRLEVVAKRPVIVLADLGGRSLRQLLPTARWSLAELLEIAISIVEGVGELHAEHVIHKDINPSNIVFNPETRELAIVDFGISTDLSSELPALSNPDVLEGTLAYISPEQTGRMNRVLDYRSDFYSLGVTLYEMFTGTLPFTGRDTLELVHRHLTQDPVPANVVAPSVPKAIAEIIAKLLAKTAEERYQSAWGIQADLENCLLQLRSKGCIEPFVLGAEDTPESFRLPQKLYGRDAEIAQLTAAFESVSHGGRELMLVAGPSGIGKTRLVRELFKPLTKHRGYFISGKFDQIRATVPYSALVQAFQELVRQLLTEHEARLQRWRSLLAAALGANGQLIVDVIPEVELIIGRQQPVPELPPVEARNRFYVVFQRFIRVFYQPEHPLVIFLDDLQWVDSATLQLVNLLMTDDDTRHLFVIGAYRDNEVGRDHPLAALIDELRTRGAPMRSIVLAPLDHRQLVELVSDALHCDAEAAGPLAGLLLTKTGGNPFFVGRFLETLDEEGLIRFEAERGGRPRWRWDLTRIERADITDNVVLLMLARMKKLAAPTIEVLRLAACLGNRFDLRTLALAHEHSVDETYAHLAPAIREGLLLPTSDLELYGGDGVSAPLVFSRFRFLHDRVQQAAHAMIPDEMKPALHRRIGALLLANLDRTARTDRVFELADHVNRGRALVTSHAERLEVAELDLEAGRKAKAATAYQAALRYLECGMETFAGDWREHYALTLAMHHERAELEYLNGNYEHAEAILDGIWQSADNVLDRAEACVQLVTQRTVLGNYDGGIAAGARGLGLLGITFPAEAALPAAVDAERAQIDRALVDRTIQSLADLPQMEAPEIKVAMKLLMTLHTCVYFANNYPLYSWVLARMTHLSIQHGNVPESSKGYASYGNTLAADAHRYEDGYEFGLLGLRLAEKYNDQSLRCKACLILSMFLNHWVHPIAEAEQFDDDGERAGMEAGELQFIGYILAYGRTGNRFYRGENLERLLADVGRFLVFTRKVKHQLSTDNLVGAEAVLGYLSGHPNDLDEARYLADAAQQGSQSAICFYETIKAFAQYLMGEYSEALAAIERAEPLLGHIKGVLTEAAHVFHHALVLAALCPGTRSEHDEAFRARLAADQRRLAEWARRCPWNFSHQRLLIDAELARLDGRGEEAMQLYDRAIATAAEHGFGHHEALGNELAAQFWLARGKPEFALLYLRRARLGYRAWGAHRKVAQLVAAYPQLGIVTEDAERVVGATEREQQPARYTLFTDHASAAHLDLASVLKSSLAISSELVLDHLIDRVMRVVLENAGAERGSLMLQDGDRLMAVASIVAGADRASRLAGTPLEAAADVPRQVVQYVARTRQSVVLHDAAREGPFTGDPYVTEAEPRSVLCVPVLHRGDLMGVVYLEHRRIAGAFSPERVEVLKILAAQAAISLQNAQLLAGEQAARRAAEEAERRAAFFAEASKLLTASLESEEILGRMAKLLVGRVADWCFLDVIENGRVRRLVTGNDPVKQQLLEDIQRRYPPRLDSNHLAMQVLRSRAPRIVADFSDELLAASCEDATHAALMRAVGTRTAMVLPLLARGRTLGVLSLGSSTRSYGPDELELAQEVAGRASIAIENAQMYRRVQASLEMRDEFIMLASHELRTPLTPLKLQNQSFRAQLERMSNEAFPDRQRWLDMLERSGRQIDGLVGLVAKLIDVSELDAGTIVLRREALDLSRLVREVVDRVGAASSARAELRVHADREVRGSWDRARLGQVVESLLSNALKYGAGSPIDVTVECVDGVARLAVQDRGIGIAAHEHAKIFERFERAVSAKVFSGLGLGLYVARKIVDAHGGTIRVVSELGQGATFIVELPRDQA